MSGVEPSASAVAVACLATTPPVLLCLSSHVSPSILRECERVFLVSTDRCATFEFPAVWSYHENTMNSKFEKSGCTSNHYPAALHTRFLSHSRDFIRVYNVFHRFVAEIVCSSGEMMFASVIVTIVDVCRRALSMLAARAHPPPASARVLVSRLDEQAENANHELTSDSR